MMKKTYLTLTRTCFGLIFLTWLSWLELLILLANLTFFPWRALLKWLALLSCCTDLLNWLAVLTCLIDLLYWLALPSCFTDRGSNGRASDMKPLRKIVCVRRSRETSVIWRFLASRGGAGAALVLRWCWCCYMQIPSAKHKTTWHCFREMKEIVQNISSMAYVFLPPPYFPSFR